ncbi:uncharacterized protein [Mobula birostris]|uniref:uncharacterized protein isoform X1 n=2 Tax=Mobula birostris TaxID=1983395 RepID=UPI003B285481
MAELSVNDHLEGILSDFEALKRSFEIDDVNDEPPFSPVSPLSSPFSPGSTEVRSPRLTEGFVSPPPSYHTKINRSSSTISPPGSAQYRKVSSSLSFNHGSKPIPRANGSAAGTLGRVSSFQSKINPISIVQSSRPGIDDGVHGSTSSLVHHSRLNSVSGPLGCHDPGVKANHVPSPALKKYLSQGNMFHSEVDRPVTSVNEGAVNHGSMPSLDLHIAEDLALEGKASSKLMHKLNVPPYSGIKSPLAQEISPGLGQRISQREPRLASTAIYPSLNMRPMQEVSFGPTNSFSNNVADSFCKAQESLITNPEPPARSLPRSQIIQNTSSTPITLTRSKQSVSMTSMHQSGDFLPLAIDTESSSVPVHQLPQFKLVTQPQVIQAPTPPHSPMPDSQPKLTQNSALNEDPILALHVMESADPVAKRNPPFSKSDDLGIHFINSNTKLTDNIYHDGKREDPPLEQEVETHLKQQGLALKEVKVTMAERTQETGLVCSEGFKKDTTGRDLFGYVGIEAVLDQMRRKAMKTGFEFNIMVVGESGLGKSTLVNTLFKSKVSRKSCMPNYVERIPRTVELQTISHIIEEKGVKMNLTVIDTPGFGDQINNENCWEPIVKYINEQYEKYLREEININRKKRIPDTRVHCCVYFVPPTGHWLRPLDIEFMNRLAKIVNIVPVIAKADTLTLDERRDFKQRIRQDLRNYSISVYPQTEFDEDSEDKLLNDTVREKIPFAVVGTDQEHQVNGKKILGRKTKWGIIEVENGAHCEFANLRDLLIRSHLQDLKDVTHRIHYESYRVRRLNESNGIIKGLPKENYVTSKEDLENNH